MYKFLISGVFILILVGSFGQDINYKPKKLYKEIQKVWDIENPDITEIELPASTNSLNHIQGKYFSVTDHINVSQSKYLYIGRVNSCRTGGCSISQDPAENFESEYFDYFVLFDSSISVQFVMIYNYMATHGHEVSAKGWLKQFSGYDGTDTLEVGKNVDAISGATISVYGITLDVQSKTQLLQNILRKNYKLTKTDR